ncbi:MAG: 23S rRNA (uracil(1939)-C(5))-methyltransferase RlmD [Eubacteriales bacterium]|nr:23S rRNA (uracil(1939)-C(5))-methyltransferase RlmD [Eubacteriales bacterium]
MNNIVCKHKDDCGGCLYQGIPYFKQVEMKEKEVLRLLDEKKILVGEYLGIVPSPRELAYRNKMEYTFGDEVKDGEMTLGMHKRGRFMSVFTTDECQLVDPDFNIIQRFTLDFCIEKGYQKYHWKSHEGFLRNLILRKGEHTNQLLVNLVTTTKRELDEEAYVSQLLSLPLKNTIVGILHTKNDNLADAVHCESLKVLYGKDYYEEKLMGLHFEVSAFSFFQTNIMAIETLYQDALSMISDFSGKTVFDLYSGTGTITQTAALKAERAIGVELVEDAVSSAKRNAALNGLTNCEFVAGDVLKVLDELKEKPDVIVLDPPRSGIHPKALQKILNYGVKEIVYVSCNPKTLVENLASAMLFGYQTQKLRIYDNFPYTKHTECVCLIAK